MTQLFNGEGSIVTLSRESHETVEQPWRSSRVTVVKFGYEGHRLEPESKWYTEMVMGGLTRKIWEDFGQGILMERSRHTWWPWKEPSAKVIPGYLQHHV